MKQTLLDRKTARFGSISLGLLLFSLSVSGQTQPADSLQSRVPARHSSNIHHAPVLTAKEFNKGFITSPEQLFSGKIPGLRVLSPGGQPGAPVKMQLHNFSSLYGSNNPLVVMDGQPLSFHDSGEFVSFINYINPHDIASVSFITADAGIAVYGSRAANGVLVLTSKRPQQTPKVTYTGSIAVSELRKKADVLSADQFRKVVQENYPDNAELLGNANTDWQDVIYRKAISHDHHISLSGAVANAVPYRVAVGHQNQQGIMKASWNKRNTVALNLSPELIKDQLGLQVNVLGAQQETRLAQSSVNAIALMFDPTQPVYAPNKYGKYFLYLDDSGEVNPMALLNPLLYLEQQQNLSNTNSLNANASLNYKLLAVPGLQFDLLYGYQRTGNKYESSLDYLANSSYYPGASKETREYKFVSQNTELRVRYLLPQLLDDLDINLMAGVSRERADMEREQKNLNYKRFLQIENGVNSVFADLQLNYKQAYRLSFSMNDQNESTFPGSEKLLSYAVGGAWDLGQTDLIQNQSLFSGLSLYTSYLKFDRKEAAYLGEGVLVSSDINPETVTKLVFGSTFGLVANKLQGNISYTHSRTKDMWLLLNVYPRDGYSSILDNMAEMSSNTVQLGMNYQVLNNPDFSWNVGTSLSYSQNQVEGLGKNKRIYYSAPGTSFLNIDPYVLEPGKPVNSFALYEQVYNSAGKPIEGAYKMDEQKNAIRAAKHSSDPSFMAGLSTDVTYKKLSLGVLLRGSAGNYVYNLAEARQGALASVQGGQSLYNLNSSYYRDGFHQRQLNSDHYIENASFLRMEYLQLGYNVGSILKDKAALQLTGTVQNAFVITKYNGQDPEVSNGTDLSSYPMPTTYSVGVKLEL